MSPTIPPSKPTTAAFPSTHLTRGAGVAIFHLASARVVLCYHPRGRYFFLPKGRLNSGEGSRQAAEREGFEESGFRNRVLPLPLKHRQTAPPGGRETFVAEPVWMELAPVGAGAQYVLFWYVAETVDPEEERALSEGEAGVYRVPGEFPERLTLRERIEKDVVVVEDGERKVYEPVRHEGTGVDEEEAQYQSGLYPIEEALRRLRGSVMGDVVRRGWEGVQLRMKMEADRGD